MTADDQKNNANGQNNVSITPAAFEPISAVTKERWAPRRSHVVTCSALAILGSVLWYLITATAVFFDTTPTNAKVDIDSALVVKLSDSHLMHSGNYPITVSAEGYLTLSTSIEVTDIDSQWFPIELQKKPGHLNLTTTPDNAVITLDDTETGTTPSTIPNISAGSHKLHLNAERYFPKTLEVDIEGLDKTQILQVDLEPAWGNLTLASQPEGAQVFVGEELRGTTPLTTELLQWGEEVKVLLDGYKPWQRILRVNANSELTVDDIQLAEIDALLHLTSKPTGAGITVNGTFMGRTPLDLALAPDTVHKVSLFLNGYHTAKRTVSIAKFLERSLDVALKAETGKIRVHTKPTNAEVLIDGIVKGRGGQTFTLPAKAHKITIRAAGYASQTKWTTPRPGIEQLLSVKLLTNQEARWANTPKQMKTSVGQPMRLFRPEAIFTMGASRREPGRRANEIQRQVSLKRGFYLSEKEVTNAEFSRFNAKHYSRQTNGITLSNPTQPVVNVSWLQAALFCNWLSKEENLPAAYTVKNDKITGFNPKATGYRLPTEAEWAWATRYQQGNMLKFPWGDNFPPKNNLGNFADLSATKVVGRIIKGYRDNYVVTSPVGKFSSNHLGLYDLGGNVAEWVNDYYGIEMNLSSKPLLDPTGPEKGEFRVIRGSSWRQGSITEIRSSFRDYGTDGRDDVGFRIARYVE